MGEGLREGAARGPRESGGGPAETSVQGAAQGPYLSPHRIWPCRSSGRRLAAVDRRSARSRAQIWPISTAAWSPPPGSPTRTPSPLLQRGSRSGCGGN
ncbi:hypothetical protein GUJ93_ZPchr0005g15760 [Zizania palustris]|uniref:Uncharacterized protein n=1 Tax=Zizania palustris TaxID=103762 RepID=A0A8J5T320_ZIZPA|nr:hypothetical protein GUJ93_ZPchr0005g15760 [Zizania palustris]